jgi:hypothetical protein
MLGYFHYLVRIEVQAYHGIVALWMFWLLPDDIMISGIPANIRTEIG